MLALFFLIAGMYTGYYEPFKVKSENKIELMNEMFFGCHLYMMMCYTDFVVTKEGQFNAGWIHISILAL